MSGAATAAFVYDGDGNRVKTTFGATATVYVGNIYELTNGVAKKYYYAGDRRIALRDNGTLHYLFPDHLSSTNVSVRADNSATVVQRYHPWGAVRPGPTNALPTGYTYTGQLDSGSGLMYYRTRHYDPSLGRFVQPDTIVPEPGNPQALNRYSYVLNNPLKYTDPTGHNPACAAGMGGGPLGVNAALACEVVPAIASVGPQVQALVVNYGPQVAQGVQQAGNHLPALVDQAARAGQASQPASNNGGNTADPGGLDPNDPRFKELARQAAEQAESASCPNCGTRDPQLLRGRGAIAARQHVELAHVGEDGISAWCTNCTSTAGKFWGRSMTEIQTFAKEIGLDPRKAAVYTPQFGGPGHWSLFIDAIGSDGYLLPQYAHLIDAFLRAGLPVIR